MKPFTGSETRESRPQGPVLGRRDGLPEASDHVDARVLAATTSEAHEIPEGARWVNFSANADFYARFQEDGTAIAIPSADVTDGTAPVLNMGAREIPEGATHIVMIAPAATIVTLEFWG
jgi:hypothetical protein